jgi:hypothetical protein
VKCGRGACKHPHGAKKERMFEQREKRTVSSLNGSKRREGEEEEKEGEDKGPRETRRGEERGMYETMGRRLGGETAIVCTGYLSWDAFYSVS